MKTDDELRAQGERLIARGMDVLEALLAGKAFVRIETSDNLAGRKYTTFSIEAPPAATDEAV